LGGGVWPSRIPGLVIESQQKNQAEGEELSVNLVIGSDFANLTLTNPDAEGSSNEIICQHKYTEPGNGEESD
jgi:hypothetical protein